jgi:Protein of unknown function (DUF1573)
MKRSLLTLALGVIFLGAFAQKGPMISLDTESIDYGTIAHGGEPNRQFTVTNTGDAPLIISQCQGSCGCTVPKCDTAPIAPGASSVVNIHYDTNRVGPFTKTVTVTSNAVNAPSKVVNIHGTVEPAPGAPGTPASPVKEVSPMMPVPEKTKG